MYTRNGEPFDINAFQVIGEVQYPIGWFYTAEHRAALDIEGEDDAPSVPVFDLTAATLEAIAKTYADVDGVVRDAVGLRAEEYKDAETDARAFAASGYAGDAPESVACFARSNPTGGAQTGPWAADQIIARADAFAVAKLSMRSNRMDRQADMRAAATATELASAIAAWEAFIVATRAQLGL